MCGICGEIRFDGKPADVGNISAMMRVLEPRGPDSSGIYGHHNYALGHRRLKIIDLSEHAAQPMVDPDLGLAIAFNGAIYNYPELRAELAASEPFHPGHAVGVAHAVIRSRIRGMDRDRAMDADVAEAVRLVSDGILLAAVREAGRGA